MTMVRVLRERGVLATLRRSAGQDVDAGCGQLRARASPATVAPPARGRSPRLPQPTRDDGPLCLFGAPTIAFGERTFALPFERRSQLIVYLGLKRSWVGRASWRPCLAELESARPDQPAQDAAPARPRPVGAAARIAGRLAAPRAEAMSPTRAFPSRARHGAVVPPRTGELLAGSTTTPTGVVDVARLRARPLRTACATRSSSISPATSTPRSARALRSLLETDPLDEARRRGDDLPGAQRPGRPGARALSRFEHCCSASWAWRRAALSALHETIGAVAATPLRRARRRRLPAAPADGSSQGGRARPDRRVLDKGDCRLLCLSARAASARPVWPVASSSRPRSLADGAAMIALEDWRRRRSRRAHRRDLGVPLAGSRDPFDQVASALGDRRMLIVLDNFEQLVADAAGARALLRDCPRLQSS